MNTHITYATQHQQEKTTLEGHELRTKTPDTDDNKASEDILEHADSEAAGVDHDHDTHVMGTVKYTTGENQYLVPSPTTDPQDPRNLPRWRKVIYVVLLSMCESLAHQCTRTGAHRNVSDKSRLCRRVCGRRFRCAPRLLPTHLPEGAQERFANIKLGHSASRL